MQKGSIKPVIFIFLLLLVLYIGAILFGWFDEFTYFDVPMHILGGMFAGSAFLFLSRGFFQHEMFSHKAEQLKIVSISVAFGALVGVLWEFLEFILGPYFEGFRQVSVQDTLGDLLNDIIGAGVYAYFVFFIAPMIVERFFTKKTNS